MDMELIVKNAVRGVMESGTTREAGWGELLRSLKMMFRQKQRMDPSITYNDWADDMMRTIETSTGATDAAARRMQ